MTSLQVTTNPTLALAVENAATHGVSRTFRRESPDRQIDMCPAPLAVRAMGYTSPRELAGRVGWLESVAYRQDDHYRAGDYTTGRELFCAWFLALAFSTFSWCGIVLAIKALIAWLSG